MILWQNLQGRNSFPHKTHTYVGGDCHLNVLPLYVGLGKKLILKLIALTTGFCVPQNGVHHFGGITNCAKLQPNHKLKKTDFLPILLCYKAARELSTSIHLRVETIPTRRVQMEILQQPLETEEVFYARKKK